MDVLGVKAPRRSNHRQTLQAIGLHCDRLVHHLELEHAADTAPLLILHHLTNGNCHIKTASLQAIMVRLISDQPYRRNMCAKQHGWRCGWPVIQTGCF